MISQFPWVKGWGQLIWVLCTRSLKATVMVSARLYSHPEAWLGKNPLPSSPRLAEFISLWPPDWRPWIFAGCPRKATLSPEMPPVVPRDCPHSTLSSLLHWLSQCVHPHEVASVVFSSLRPYGLCPARLLCPWDSPGKNNGEGCHALLQGIFLTQRLNMHRLHLLHWRVNSLPLAPTGKPTSLTRFIPSLSHFSKWQFHLLVAQSRNFICGLINFFHIPP